MRRILLLAALMVCLPTAAQHPLIECGNSYECCIRKYPSAESCGPATTSSARQAVEKVRDATEAAQAIANLEDSATLATAIDGESINSQLIHIARHLALMLELDQVGGVPPGEPPNKQTHKHWWREIKTAVRNIHQKMKNCRSRNQLMAALGKARNQPSRTPEQIADIEARLSMAARMMGEEIGELLPCL